MFFGFRKKFISIIIKFFELFIKSILIIPRGTCRFYPSCSDYAHEAIKKLPLHLAIIKISVRLLKCNPFFKGGYDPVLNK